MRLGVSRDETGTKLEDRKSTAFEFLVISRPRQMGNLSANLQAQQENKEMLRIKDDPD